MMILAILIALVALAAIAGLLSIDQSILDVVSGRALSSTAAAPTVLWPALGCPARAVSSGTISVVVGNGTITDGDPVSARLLPLSGSEPLELGVCEVRIRETNSVDSPGPWPEWILRNYPNSLVLELVLPEFGELGIHRSILCDLEVRVGNLVLTKVSSVYLARASSSTVTILTATDIHVSHRWEDLNQAARELFPRRPVHPPTSHSSVLEFNAADVMSTECFRDSMIDANRNLAEFITIANGLWDRGEIDAVLLTGDLVDYKFARRRTESGSGFEDTEWSLFESIVLGRTERCQRLRAPLYTALGNHDYRLYPYKIQIYGIRHAGVADEMSTEYLRRSGQRKTLAYALSDLDAIRIDTGRVHSLNDYYEHFCPFNTYVANMPGVHIVVLDTGPDFYCDRSNLALRRWTEFLLAAIHRDGGPRSSGFDQRQLDLLERELSAPDQDAAIVVSHTPVLNIAYPPLHQNGAVALPLRVAPEGSSESSSERIAFEKLLIRRGFSAAAILRNSLPFLTLLKRAKRQVLVLSGHTHRKLEIAVGKSDGQVSVGYFSSQSDLTGLLDDHALLLQTSALGHIKRDDLTNGRPGYRILTFERGRCRSAPTCSLDVSPFADGFDDWIGSREKDADHVRLILHRNPTQDGRPKWTKVVCWLRGDAASISRAILDQMSWKADLESVVTAVMDRRHAEQGGYFSLLVRCGGSIGLTIERRPSSVPIAFVFERYVEEAEGFRSLSLRLHHRILG